MKKLRELLDNTLILFQVACLGILVIWHIARHVDAANHRAGSTPVVQEASPIQFNPLWAGSAVVTREPRALGLYPGVGAHRLSIQNNSYNTISCWPLAPEGATAYHPALLQLAPWASATLDMNFGKDLVCQTLTDQTAMGTAMMVWAVEP